MRRRGRGTFFSYLNVIYAHVFAGAEHADRTRERMEQAFGELLR